MHSEDFNRIFDFQIDRSAQVLKAKADEYAPNPKDRLSNFKVAATLQDNTIVDAIIGMMAKHTVSIYDMAQAHKTYSIEQWDEKITDHINYLILLRAALAEEDMNPKF